MVRSAKLLTVLLAGSALTLAAGAAIVLPDPADEREPGRWADLMRRHQVTIWHSVPALLQMLVDRVSQLS